MLYRLDDLHWYRSHSLGISQKQQMVLASVLTISKHFWAGIRTLVDQHLFLRSSLLGKAMPGENEDLIRQVWASIT